MLTVLRYGTDSSVRLECVNGEEPSGCGMPRGTLLEDLPAAVGAALDEPLDYPPLRQSTTPGDRVVLALGQGLPRAAEVTAAVIHALVAAGVEPDGISVLRSELGVDVGTENPCRLLLGAIAERVRLVTHDAANRASLAYLAAAPSGEPVFLNRLLTDADLVLSVGCLHGDGTAGYFGIHTPIFPTFSDFRTQLRFRQIENSPGDGRHRRELAREANNVAWLLGINFTIQLIPGAGDGVLHVLAGQSDAVRRHGRELYRAAWTSLVARRASLVVAAIEGGSPQQTWENLGRALSTAGRLVEDGGAIAVCCALAAQPGPAVQCMRGARSRRAAVRHIRRDSPADAVPAAQLARALDRNHIYLLSRLDPVLVEELDMVPLGGPEELVRLARHHTSCILLANAPRALVRVEDE